MKVLRFFPLKSRLQQLFMSTKTTADMKWHHEKRINDEVLQHLVDCEAWKKFYRSYETFAMDPRDVRLGLATNGSTHLEYMEWHWCILEAID